MDRDAEKTALEARFIASFTEITRLTTLGRRLAQGEDPVVVQAELRDVACPPAARRFVLTGVARLAALLRGDFPDSFTEAQSRMASLGYLTLMSEASLAGVREHTEAVLAAVAGDRPLPDDEAGSAAIAARRRRAEADFACQAQDHGLSPLQAAYTSAAWRLLEQRPR